MKSYDHKKIEKKWQKEWSKNKIYRQDLKKGKKKAYVLDMFPYPSGEGLHVGHPKGYIATDIYSRYKKMKGFNILHPMGWDAFGLPAENFAIKNKIHPKIAVDKNIKRYKEQLEILGFNYDWSREINTTDPKYYKWTQWIFLQMLKKGLAYQSYEPINWCPSCQTGLANEDLEDGKCERCGSVVEKKPMRQWVLKITDYAERLLKDLEGLDWPESIKESQRNWIGKSEGAEIDFILTNSNLGTIKVFTTRPDTIFGATYLVLAPEHKMIPELKNLISNWQEVSKYIEETKNKTEIERTAEGKTKTGIELKGIKAINPGNKEEIPVWIADYVLTDYGTGAIMAVPAHDKRDFEFSKKHNLSVKQVIEPSVVQSTGSSAFKKNESYKEGEGIIALIKHWNEDKYLGLKWKEAPDWGTLLTGGINEGMTADETVKKEILEETGFKNFKRITHLGKVHSKFYHVPKKTNKFIHGYIYYVELENGEQNKIDEIEKNRHEMVWMTKKELEKFLTAASHQEALKMLNGDLYTGYGFLANSGEFDSLSSEEAKEKIIKFVGGKKKTTFKIKDWVFSRQRYWGEPIPVIHCENCGPLPVPEKDLPVELPKVKNYEPTGTGESPLANIEKWVNVKCPKCKGKAKRETNTMPQWAGSCWYYLRFTDPKNNKALADKKIEKYWSPVDVYAGGDHAVRHLIYARFWHKFLYDIGSVSVSEPFKRLKYLGFILAPNGRKMSKRYGNVINPDDVVKTWGADTLRVYEMFMGPFEQTISWSTDNMIGSRRFLEKVWRLKEKVQNKKSGNLKLEASVNETVKKVSEDIESFNFNTAISSLMILTNELDKEESVQKTHYESLLKLLSPFAPHIAEELWREIGNKSSVHISSWPVYKKINIKKTIKIAIQINGKVRDIIEAEEDESEESITKKAMAKDSISSRLKDQKVKKIIYVKNKILSIVVN